jgi:hypothetical protein
MAVSFNKLYIAQLEPVRREANSSITAYRLPEVVKIPQTRTSEI